MPSAYLQPRKYYEDLYDKITVELCREREHVINHAFSKAIKHPPPKEAIEGPGGWYVMYSLSYHALVETPAAERYEEREKTIRDWMQEAEQEDKRLETATPTFPTPYCLTCGKDLELVDKLLVPHHPDSMAEDIVFVYACKPCKKRTGIHEDGTEWVSITQHCEKCGGDMEDTARERKDVITITSTCQKCGHSTKYKLDTKEKTDKSDPHYAVDRRRFCWDAATMDKYRAKAENLARLEKIIQQAKSTTELAAAITKPTKELTIAKLADSLRIIVEKEGNRDFKLGEPELSKQVIVGFSCLETKDDRKERRSKKELQAIIAKTLEDTNWHLMSDGIHARLGYLNGRLKADEQKAITTVEDELMAGSVSVSDAQDTIKSHPRKRKGSSKAGKIRIRAVLNRKLFLVIPPRDNDDSVPEFVRRFRGELES